jgi:hypothetical protein
MIDRVGRRKPLIWGTVAIAIALICEAVIGSQINTENPQHGLSIAGVFFLFCVTVIFSCMFFIFPPYHSKYQIILRPILTYMHSLLGTDQLGLYE